MIKCLGADSVVRFVWSADTFILHSALDINVESKSILVFTRHFDSKQIKMSRCDWVSHDRAGHKMTNEQVC